MGATINGIEKSWASITVKVRGVEIIGFKAISYSDSVSREKVYGAGRMPIAMTRGKYETEQGSITCYERQFREILALFAPNSQTGWADVVFDIECRYSDPGEATHVDVLEACRWAGAPGGGEEGSSPLEREMQFDCMRICRDGKYLVAPSQQPQG